VIAVDTNILIYAHRADSPWHEPAAARLTGLAEGRASWGIPWPCVHEFLATVTHPKVFSPPTEAKMALAFLEALAESPSLVFLGEADTHLAQLGKLVLSGRVDGPRIHDARIAAICLGHGVDELWTADRDFGRFPSLSVRNPLVE
jgi:toxin-antitoxin system PIN domain toxin